MPYIARDHGAVIIEVNPEPTPLTAHISNLTLLSGAGSILPSLVEAVQRRRASS
jgi:NAD-dependent deacetylase